MISWIRKGRKQSGSAFLVDKWNIAKTSRICYNAGRQKADTDLQKSTKNPRVAARGFFYAVLARWIRPQAHCRLFVSVQPFANEVGHYTCRNRNQKSSTDILQSQHLPSLPFWRRQRIEFIMNFGKNAI